MIAMTRFAHVPHLAIFFILTWLIIGGLFELKLSYLLDGFNEEFLLFFIANFFIFILGCVSVWFYFWTIKSRTVHDQELERIVNAQKLIKLNNKMILVFFIINIVQIIISDGLPIIWLIQDTPKTYFDYGIHGLNGFANAVFINVQLNNFFLWKICNNNKVKRRYKKLFLFLLLWPILVISRQMIMTMAIECIVMWLIYNHLSLKRVIAVMSTGCFIIYGFGVIGDARTGSDFFKEIAEPRYEWLDSIPSGVLWGYIYATTPVANAQYTFENVTPDDTFEHTFGKLIPSTLREEIFKDSNNLSDQTQETGLISPRFTVSSYLHSPLMDKGGWFVLLYSFIIGILSSVITYNLRVKRTVAAMFIYCVYAQMLILSIFDDMFLYLPILFQIVIAVKYPDINIDAKSDI